MTFWLWKWSLTLTAISFWYGEFDIEKKKTSLGIVQGHPQWSGNFARNHFHFSIPDFQLLFRASETLRLSTASEHPHQNPHNFRSLSRKNCLQTMRFLARMEPILEIRHIGYSLLEPRRFKSYMRSSRASSEISILRPILPIFCLSSLLEKWQWKVWNSFLFGKKPRSRSKIQVHDP